MLVTGAAAVEPSPSFMRISVSSLTHGLEEIGLGLEEIKREKITSVNKNVKCHLCPQHYASLGY